MNKPWKQIEIYNNTFSIKDVDFMKRNHIVLLKNKSKHFYSKKINAEFNME